MKQYKNLSQDDIIFLINSLQIKNKDLQKLSESKNKFISDVSKRKLCFYNSLSPSIMKKWSISDE